ncbi:YdbC family protein [Caldalkalibacillus mannanilyticus]|uniref:YdbC family protein n=1 Tax=Caldalkalibacillus mannanilyticus TaxID=1418 RepID=UPI000469E3D6|nr:YdbC family protein [Caldalkalibacillus mannanilyticus]
MLIKWIECVVPADKREGFSRSQEQWKVLKEVKGCLGQVGGWSIEQNSLACILGIWKDQEAYKHFMDHEHDQIIHRNNQTDLFESISVSLFQPLGYIQGDDQRFREACLKERLLLVEEIIYWDMQAIQCNEVQKEKWNQENNNQSGIHSGVIAQDFISSNRFLLMTIWDDKHRDEIEVEKRVQRLKTEKGIKDVQSKLIRIDENWRF